MPQIDQVRVCSMALSHIGNKQLMSINQPGNSAEACRLWWDITRLEALRGAPWNFARRWKSGVLIDTPAFPPYSFAYAYPPEALRIFYFAKVEGFPDGRAFKVSARNGQGGKMISTDNAAPVFIYTIDTPNVSEWDADFVSAFSYLLASKIAMPLTKSKDLEDKMWKKWIALSSVAEAAARNEGAPTEEPLAYYQEVR